MEEMGKVQPQGTTIIPETIKSNHSPSIAKATITHVPKCHIHMVVNSLLDEDSTPALGSPFQYLTLLSMKKLFLIFEDISPCPITYFLGEEMAHVPNQR